MSMNIRMLNIFFCEKKTPFVLYTLSQRRHDVVGHLVNLRTEFTTI